MTVVTGEYGAQVLGPLLAEAVRGGVVEAGAVELLAVRNDFFGGNTAVTGLLTGADLARALDGRPADRRYLLPDVCLSEGRFLDGLGLADLPVAVEVVPADGASLRRALVRPRAGGGRPAAGGGSIRGGPVGAGCGPAPVPVRLGAPAVASGRGRR